MTSPSPMKSPDRDAADERVKLWLSIAAAEHPLSSYDIFILRKHLHDAASELATLRRRVETGSERIIRYGQHLPNCPRGEAFAAGDVIPRECKCGFSDAISEAMFASPLPPGRNEG